MTITIGMLNILADKYGFDIDEARATIGLPPSSKRGRPSKSDACSGTKCSVLPSVPTYDKKAKVATVMNAAKTPRGKSGFHLYMADIKERVGSELRSNLKKGEKLTGGAVMSEAGRRWRNLPSDTRAIWNDKAGK